MSRMKISKKVLFLLKILLTLALILFLIKRLKMGEVKHIILQIKLSYLFLAVSFYLCIMVLTAYRWQCLLRIQRLKFGMLELIRLTFIGFFFNNFLPTTVGGDLIKGYLVAQKTKKTAESYVSVVMDRLMGVAGLFVMAFAVIWFIPSLQATNRIILYAVWGGFIIMGVLVVLSTIGSKRWRGKLGFLKSIVQKFKIDVQIKKIYHVFAAQKQYKNVLIKTILLSLLVQVCFVAVNCFIVKGLSMHGNVPLVFFFVYIPTIALISSLPITINGIGIRENLYVVFFSGLIGMEVAGSLSIILLLFLWAAGIAGGICYLFSHVKIAPIKTLIAKEEAEL